MKQKYITKVLFLALFGTIFASCSENKLNSQTIFPDVTTTDNTTLGNKLEQWVTDNYLLPYNVDFQYRLDEIETDRIHNVVPADSAKAAKLAIIIKYMWYDAYNEVAGQHFVKQNTPRVLTLVGNPAYNPNATETLGTAEGGYKVTLYRVNSLTNNLISNRTLLNLYFLHTMHHEFTHILNQRKPYDSAFDLITPSTYISGDWYQMNNPEENWKEGFVSSYARSEPREDFAEMLAFYVTETPEEWNNRLEQAGERGAGLINQKLALVKAYMQTEWNIDLDLVRDAVLRRGANLSSLDLETLN